MLRTDTQAPVKMNGLCETLYSHHKICGGLHNLLWFNHIHCMDLNSLYHALCELEEVGHVV